MKRKYLCIVPALLCFQTLVLAQGETKYKELPNFHQVNQGLYRGGQPKQGGFEMLKKLGIKTVIDLRNERGQAESSEAQTNGMQYFNFPMERMGKPDDATVEKVLDIISNSDHQPVFVHCAKGADRTGTIIAVYRIKHDGWTSEQAKAEAKSFGMAPWQVQMKNYIHDYYKRQLKTVAR
jgi:protein tyrosine/serine phosphatase